MEGGTPIEYLNISGGIGGMRYEEGGTARLWSCIRPSSYGQLS